MFYQPLPFSSLLQQILWFDCPFPGKDDNGQVRLHPFWKVKRRIVSRAKKFVVPEEFSKNVSNKNTTMYRNPGDLFLFAFGKYQAHS